MKKIAFFCFFILALLLYKLGLFHTSSSPIDIAFVEDSFPIVELSIDKNKHLVELFLGGKYPLMLSKACLSSLKKKDKGYAKWRDPQAKDHLSSLFEVSNVNVGKVTLKRVATGLLLPDENLKNGVEGEFCWPFEKINLFLDLPHGQIIPIKEEKEVKKFGYDIKKMKKIPCEITNQELVFKVASCLGETRLTLATSANHNLINRSLWDHKERLNTSIHFEDKEVAKIKMTPFDLPSEFKIDGVLGLEFLKERVVYIDARQKCLYVGSKYPNICLKGSKIPVKFLTSGCPIINLRVGATTYPIMLDLGSIHELLLPQEFLASEKLRDVGTITSVDIEGNQTLLHLQLLPSYFLEKTEFKRVLVGQATKSDLSTRIYSKKNGDLKLDKYGYLGSPILERTNIFFDFPNSYIYLISNKKEFDLMKLDLASWEKVPFQMEKGRISIETKTSLKKLRLVLDTGATVSLIRSEYICQEDLFKDELGNLVFKSPFFVLGEHNYGEKKFHPISGVEKLELDGILGMDFLRDHLFYIDYPNRIIYFKKNAIASVCIRGL